VGARRAIGDGALIDGRGGDFMAVGFSAAIVQCMARTSRWDSNRPDSDRSERRTARSSFAETALKLAEIAPTIPPPLIAHGLELTHRLRRTFGDRPVEASLWEELLALRRGPGCDAFLATPLPLRDPPEDLLLERAVEARALVDAVRNNRFSHDGQPLDRILRKGMLRTRRVVVADDEVPVCFRLGCWYAVVGVGDEHPRALRDRIEAALSTDAREVGTFRTHPINAPLMVAIDPVPFAWSLHLHRLGVQGPWLSWSQTADGRPMGVLAVHHLVLEGPGIAALRSDFRRRVKAMRIALGLDGAEEDHFEEEGFGPFDAAPFDAFGPEPADELHPGMREPTPEDLDLLAQLYQFEAEEEARLPHRHTFAYDPQECPEAPARGDVPAGLPPLLQDLVRRRPFGRLPHEVRHGLNPPSVRYATVHRGAFSLPDFCYAYCRAQHDAMAVHHPKYSGQGFTFIVPHIPRDDEGVSRPGRRGKPVLCSFRTRRGVPEGSGSFKRRMVRRLAEADEGRDLLTRVLDDVLRTALPGVIKAAMVRFFEHGIGDGGTFLGGRGLVAQIVVPDELVDPIAQYAGLYEGHFGGSCQERGGISLNAIDRGYRRDLCAVGTGIFRDRAPMDLFWQRFAFFLAQAAM
jgi:hypothetical protein